MSAWQWLATPYCLAGNGGIGTNGDIIMLSATVAYVCLIVGFSLGRSRP